MNALKGYKTYLIAAAIGAITAAHALGYIDDMTFDMLIKLLGAGGLATMAAKVNRLIKHTDPTA